MFSTLYAVNIAVSNASLHLVTVPFHQVVRATTPIFTMMLSMLLYNTGYSREKLYSLMPVILGVVLATYGDYYFTAWGLCLTLVGTVLASLKTVFTNVLQSSPKPDSRPLSVTPKMPQPVALQYKRPRDEPIGWQDLSLVTSYIRTLLPPRLDLHPLDLLTRMSPLAFVQCLMYAYMSGELGRIGTSMWWFGVSNHGADLVQNGKHQMDLVQVLILLFNGCIAFGLNVVSFSANGKVGALSMTVAANVKQVLTILFAVSLFDLTITPTNALGISATLIGGAWYAWVEYNTKRRAQKGNS
ncbi:hypothetical protein EW026_g2873 [Hermanssonia centrifuga]|uniref:Sugar phosphate transporter domain-containing protein n=1 Tax=Hermanssonia centrifuga TaxID=98765 RepID=A0A4S4KLX5_9APHY|nr:hypothetical protein EW026_g2873 [Hermanssonia centrifuga]